MAKFTLVVDSSQIACYLECPQKWVNQYVKRLLPIKFTPDESMNAGTYGHRLLEIIYKMKARGAGINDCVEASNAYNPDTDVCECGCSKDYHCPIPLLDIEECRRCKKCAKFRPHPLYLNSLTRSVVRKRIIDYMYKYQAEDIIPLSENHVEIGFSENIYEDSENLFILEGRIDILGKLQGLDIFMDHKFQIKRYWLYLSSVQLKNYALITKTPAAMLNYIRLHQKVQPDTLNRELITFNSVQLMAWHKRLIQIYFRMKKTIQAVQSAQREGVEKNWSACSGDRLTFDKDKPQYCWYGTLCEEIDPRIVDGKERTLFKINEQVWRPW